MRPSETSAVSRSAEAYFRTTTVACWGRERDPIYAVGAQFRRVGDEIRRQGIRQRVPAPVRRQLMVDLKSVARRPYDAATMKLETDAKREEDSFSRRRAALLGCVIGGSVFAGLAVLEDVIRGKRAIETIFDALRDGARSCVAAVIGAAIVPKADRLVVRWFRGGGGPEV